MNGQTRNRQMKKHNITSAEWLKIETYIKATITRLQRRMPTDWQPEYDDLHCVCFDAVLAILNSYKPGSLSPSAYCYQFLEKTTFSELIKEYHKLKLQDTLYSLGELDDGDDGDFCTHKRGKADVSETTDFPMKKIEDKDLLGKLYDSCDDVDTRHAIACMYFLGWSLTQAAKECKMTKQTLLARLRALGKRFTK